MGGVPLQLKLASLSGMEGSGRVFIDGMFVHHTFLKNVRPFICFRTVVEKDVIMEHCFRRRMAKDSVPRPPAFEWHACETPSGTHRTLANAYRSQPYESKGAARIPELKSVANCTIRTNRKFGCRYKWHLGLKPITCFRRDGTARAKFIRIFW